MSHIYRSIFIFILFYVTIVISRNLLILVLKAVAKKMVRTIEKLCFFTLVINIGKEHFLERSGPNYGKKCKYVFTVLMYKQEI